MVVSQNGSVVDAWPVDARTMPTTNDTTATTRSTPAIPTIARPTVSVYWRSWRHMGSILPHCGMSEEPGDAPVEHPSCRRLGRILRRCPTQEGAGAAV